MIQKSEEAFKLKASFLPMTVIQLSRSDQRSVAAQLKEIRSLAPHYFHQSPVVLDVRGLKRPAKGLDLAKLCHLLRAYELLPVGVQGLSPAEEIKAQELGLALWKSGSQEETVRTSQPQSEPQPEPESKPAISQHTPPRTESLMRRSPLVITKPVRSGMRIYAKESHLVLLAPVSSGAECIADGDIYCYAPVRGRLLAGGSGDVEAKIFCQTLEAELIAVAGYYLIYEECPAEREGYFQIELKEGKIQISNFSLDRSVLCQK